MKRLWLIGGAIVLFIVLSKVLLENAAGIRFDALAADWLSDPGAGAAFTVFALLVADLVLPIPSSVVMVMSGALFGVVAGGLLSLAGALGRAVLGFELARRYGRGGAQRLAGRGEVARLERIFERYGAGAVVMTRPLPIVQETMSVIAGLSTMRRGPFLLATIAGTIPEVAVYAYAGALSKELGTVVPAIVILVVLTGVGWMVYRWQQARKAAP